MDVRAAQPGRAVHTAEPTQTTTTALANAEPAALANAEPTALANAEPTTPTALATTTTTPTALARHAGFSSEN